MLLTGLACSSPLHTYAADWLSSGKSDAAQAVAPAASVAAAAAPTAPTPPLPPSPLTPDKPASTSSVAAKPPVQDQAKPQDKTTAKSATSTMTNTWQSLTAWFSPPASTSKNPPQSKGTAATPAAASTDVASAASVVRAPSTSRPTTTVGRFDPEFGPAGYSVSDATEPGAQVPPRLVPSRLVPQPQPAAEKEQSAVASDEPVSLVSWLSSCYSGGHGHGGTADACPDVCLTDTCCPKWEAQVDALFLWQGNIPSRPLYVGTATGVTALDANQLYAPAAIAPRYALTYHRDDCRAIEVNYFQVWGFNAEQVVGPQTDAAGNGVFTANNLVGPDYDRVSGALATSSANIQSLEVNLRRTDGGMIEWISGFRWLEWGQNLAVTDSTVDIPQGIPPATLGYDYAAINTLNSLYGWQLGGDMMLWNAGRWLRVNGIAKAGVYYNHQAAQNTYYTDFFNAAAASSANDTVSFVGETGINASFALTNWLSWRAGYTCFWLGGVATPARQLGLTDIDTNTTSINTNGSVFLHGVNTGLEARW